MKISMKSREARQSRMRKIAVEGFVTCRALLFALPIAIMLITAFNNYRMSCAVISWLLFVFIMGTFLGQLRLMRERTT